MIVKEESNNTLYKQPDAGIYNAVCVGLVDMGTTENTYDETKPPRRQAMIEWELIDEYIEKDGKKERHTFASFYTLSLHEKAKLRKHLTGWRGREFTEEELKGFELKNIIGTNCVLVLQHNQNGKATISSISKWKKDKVEPEGNTKYFTFEEFDGTFPEWMSDGLANLCRKSFEYEAYSKQAIKNDTANIAHAEDLKDEEHDDVPF